MKHKPHSSFCAAAAISAALALGSTSALAQEAASTVTLPSPATAAPPQAVPPSASAPSIVLPEPAPAAAPSPAAAEAPAEPAPRAERSAPRAVRQAAAPAPAEPASAAPMAPAEPIATPDTPAPVPFDLGANEPQAAASPAPEASQPDSVRSSVDVPDEIVIGSIAGVIGLGIAGFLALRRRRSDEVLLEDPYEAEPQFSAEAPVTSVPEALAVRPQPQPAAFSAAGPVPTGEARQQLIEQMVAAEPDEDNPFTSGTARRKRARLILQAREAEQAQQPTQPFDWRTYRSPERADPVPAPMVDA